MPTLAHARLVLCACLVTLLFESGCQRSGGGRRAVGSGVGGTTSGPEATPPPDPNVGQTVPPVTADQPVTIETADKAGIRHLIFEASDTTLHGRRTSEFLMVVRSAKNSCISVKIRPTTTISDGVSEDIATSGEQQASLCKAAAPLALVEETEPRYEFIQKPPMAALQLAATTPSRCSARIFRMETEDAGQDVNLDKVATKTGRLMVIGERVRIWLDEEYSNVCVGGSSLDTRPATSFGPLIQSGIVPAGTKDKLWESQLINLKDEMDRLVSRMTNSLGSPSDIDKSGYVEVFLSPEVNRLRLKADSDFASNIDEFHVNPIFKPQDLAYYNSQTNPTSNEGEVIYLWTPDPAGIYGTLSYPSSNSITSNYAKGYLAAQLANLIYFNEKIIKQKLNTIENSWLVQSLSLVSSAIFAGNDYTSLFLSQYLTSRPQYISLTQKLDSDQLSDAYLSGLALYEQLGMRTLFGWYLHNKVCGEGTVAPCDGLKKFYSGSAKTGEALVAEVLGMSYENAVKNFALSLAVGLVENRSYIFDLWNKPEAGSTLPARPVKFADLTEIFPNAVPQTVEIANNGSLLSGNNDDRTVAGPYPNRRMLLMQPLAPDYDLEFKLVPDSVAIFLVTGLVNPTMDAAAYLGEGLTVNFIPIGDRNIDLRNIHFEKQSERAPSDVRPVNLTNSMDSTKIYSQEPYYAGDAPMGTPNNFTVSQQREVWSIGSISNFTVNTASSVMTVGGSDASIIEFQPCLGMSGTELSNCQTRLHKAVVQVHIRDAEKELKPMLVLTSPDREIFRGHSIIGRYKVLDQSFEEKGSLRGALCAVDGSDSNALVGVSSFDYTTDFVTTTTLHGLTDGQIIFFAGKKLPRGLAPYQRYSVDSATPTSFKVKNLATNSVIDFFDAGDTSSGILLRRLSSESSCANGGVAGARNYSDRQSRLSPPGYNHNYQNYLMQGSAGYPFTTRGTINFEDMPICYKPVCYQAYEAYNQYLNFDFDSAFRDLSWVSYPSLFGPGYDLSSNIGTTPTESIKKLAYIKKIMDDPNCDDTIRDDPTEAYLNFQSACFGNAGLTDLECARFCTKNNNHIRIEATVRNYFKTHKATCLPKDFPDCEQFYTLMSDGTPPLPGDPNLHTTQWLDPQNYAEVFESLSSTNTFYRPLEPWGADDYCMGRGDDPGGFQFGRCRVRADSVSEMPNDIRAQLNVPTSRVSTNCYKRSFEAIGDSGVDVCIDTVSAGLVSSADNRPYAFEYKAESLPTDRARIRSDSSIFNRSSEIISKPERFQAVVVDIPGTGAIVNLMVGGRTKSQGKYILRARFVDFR